MPISRYIVADPRSRTGDSACRALAATGLAQQLHRLREGVLLAHEARDKAPAPRDAARLQAPQRPEDLAPGQHEALAGEHVAEHDAVASQELLGHRLGERLDVGALPRAILRLRIRQQRPPALDGDAFAGLAAQSPAPRRPGRAPGPALARGEERTHAAEAVRGHEATGDEIPQALLDLDTQASRRGDQLAVEERPPG